MNPRGGTVVIPGAVGVGKRIPYGNWKERIYCCLAIDAGVSFFPRRELARERAAERGTSEREDFGKSIVPKRLLMRFLFFFPAHRPFLVV